MRSRRTNWTGAVALAAVALACGGAESGAERWNVLLVTLDTTRADVLGTYGSPNATPALDAVAAEGWVFETAYSTAAVTPVSHASMLTGLNPYRHGLRVLHAPSGYHLGDDVPSLATRLSSAGWSTAAVHSAFPVSAHFGLDQGFEVFESFDTELYERNGKAAWSVADNQRRSDATSDLVLDLLGRSEEPFFLWLHYWDPHDAQLKPPPEYWPSPEEMRSQPHAGYLAEVRYMDAQIGRVVDALRASGEWERTVVIVTADHGEGLNEHGWLFHRLLYDEQIRVPLILRIPGEAPRRVSELASHVDLVPTVLEVLGLPGAEALDGVDLRRVARGELGPRTAYADQINNYDENSGVGAKRPDDGFLYSVTDGRWKLIYKPLAPAKSELYDVARDPHEADNRFATATAERDRLLRELAARGSWVTAPFPDDGSGPGAEASQRLSGLGYVGAAVDEAVWVFGCIDHGAREGASPPESCGREGCDLPLLLMSRP